jgi:hypothetical protein
MNGKQKYINPDKNYTEHSHFKRVEVLKLGCGAVLINESSQDHAYQK